MRSDTGLFVVKVMIAIWFAVSAMIAIVYGLIVVSAVMGIIHYIY